jgi:hypothetical protein
MNYYGSSYRPPKTKVFISFDYDHDEDIKNLFCGQAKHDDTPFEITDMSVKEALIGDWKEKVRQKIRRVDQVVVICGEYTHTATGVAAEVRIAQEENKPYFHLWGRNGRACTKATTATTTDKIYNWTWENVGTLLNGGR